MRWIRAIASRLSHFGGVWSALLCGSCCAGLKNGEPDAWTAIRVSLFLATAMLMLVELRRVNEVIAGLGVQMKAAGVKVPDRPGRWFGPFLVLFLLTSLPTWALWFAITSTAVDRAASKSGAAALFATSALASAWTLTTLLWVLLVLAGGTLVRRRWATRRLVRDTSPKSVPVLPWSVAAWSACALLLTLGIPSPECIVGTLRVALLVLAPGQGNSRVATASDPPFEVLVTLAPGRTIAQVDAIEATDATVQIALPSAQYDITSTGTYLVSVPQQNALGAVFLLKLDADVAGFQLNSAVTAEPLTGGGACINSLAMLPVNDPLATHQPEVQEVGGSAALKVLASRRPQRPAVVAVIDTGVDGTHTDLRAVMTPWAISDDSVGHGTAVAGVVGAITDNGRGVASLNERGDYIRVRSYPALAGQSPKAHEVADAIWDAADDSVDVINLSFSSSGTAPDIVQRAIKHAQDRGTIVVASAGNNGGDASASWPANVPGVLVVGATTQGSPARFSNTTYRVADRVWAPGDGICTLNPSGGYSRQSGTSVAAPMVSGLLGTMRALCPKAPASELIGIVERSGLSVGRGLGGTVRADIALQALFLLHPECDIATTRPVWTFPPVERRVYDPYEPAPRYYAPPEPVYPAYDNTPQYNWGDDD